MFKWIAIGMGLILLTALMVEVVGLAVLHHNRGSFAEYWQEQAVKPGEFVYVALGDSVAQGLGASQPANGYVGQIATIIGNQTGKRVRIINLSRTGAKVQDVINQQLPQLKKYKPDLVTLDIGANDMGSFEQDRFFRQYKALAEALPANAIVANVPYAGGRSTFNRNASQANATIKTLAPGNDLRIVDIYSALAPRQSPLIYAPDFYHPSDRGYEIWTTTMWKTIAPLL